MARTLEQVSRLTASEATAQWRSVLQRPVPTKGKRQDDFLPIEDLLCFGLLQHLSPNQFGGRNLLRAPAVLRIVSETLRRPATSLLEKMRNLQGIRPNGQRADVAVYLALEGDRSLAARLGQLVVNSARVLAVGADRVPDLWSNGVDARHGDALGQDEVGAPELELALREHQDRMTHTRGRLPLDALTTERLVELRVRRGQRLFAAGVLRNYQDQCGFCGMSSPPSVARTLLRASHIKPWCESTDRERLDVSNGVSACPTHDAAFDAGLLLVNGGHRIHLAPSMRSWLEDSEPARHAFGHHVLADRLRLPVGATPPHPQYLRHHLTRWSWEGPTEV